MRPWTDASWYLSPLERWLVVLAVMVSVLEVGLDRPLPTAAASLPGSALSWGWNEFGQLGDGSTTSRSIPGEISGLGGSSAVIALAAGGGHSLALLGDGTVMAWGRNGFGQLGDGTTNDRGTPAPVSGLGPGSGVVAIAAGSFHNLALLSNGTVMAWGSNDIGQSGDGTTTNSGCFCKPTPIVVSGLGAGSGVVAIAAGYNHSLVLMGNGAVKAWGRNDVGQLGDGTVVANGCVCKPAPVAVSGLGAGSGVTAVAAGFDHSMALLSDGTVKAWGYNDNGQLGSGSATATGCQCEPSPVAVSGLGAGSGVIAIDAGQGHSLALSGDGTVKSWGLNPATPTTVSGLGAGSGAIAIDAGGLHNLVLLSNGTVMGWGFNLYGQVGDGTTSDRTTPVAVSGLSGVVAIAANSYHSLALVGVDLTLNIAGTGGGTITPAGTTSHVPNSMVTVTATPNANSLFIGWLRESSVLPSPIYTLASGWASPATLTMNTNHTLTAIFVARPTFSDVNSNTPFSAAIIQLNARGIIKGKADADCAALGAAFPCFDPDGNIVRAQMAALIARAMGWDTEDHSNSFTDQCSTPTACIDENLWRNVGTLQFYAVAKGFDAAGCAGVEASLPCYGPRANVSHAQAISFITRAMVKKGYWTQQPNNPAIYGGGVPDAHQQDVTTYVFYTGQVPTAGLPSSSWPDWNVAAKRGWFSEALWEALNQYFAQDRLP